MSRVVTMGSAPRNEAAGGGGAGAPVGHAVLCADGPGPARAVAYVERELPPGGIPAYRAARRGGARSFVLWADEHRRERLATLVTVSAGGGVATYRVLGAHGELIGTLVREKALRGRGLRTRWTVTPADGDEAVGLKGRIVWWFVWWLFVPVQTLVILLSLLGGDGDAARGPRRIVWRARREVPMEFRSGGDALHLRAPGYDWRLGAALLVVLRSFDSPLLGREWDDAEA
ncbi:hypothetical protein ABZ371_16965 [Streptomyces sp. NPDC005899]|uniref:hypothetical protein n=1 Tax=Streptomyces sp. NPDC005899 TaxID=3155716 RepID=UPI0033F956ED